MFRIPTAVLFLVLSQATALAFDDQKFCEHLERFSRTPTRIIGKWVDKITRNDGTTVLCGTKSVEFKKTFNVGFEKMQSDWRAVQQRTLNDNFCKAPSWRNAILAGWTVANSCTAPNGARETFVAAARKRRLAGSKPRRTTRSWLLSTNRCDCS